jgi:wyosine [tRNA(Phe)-imidazoG37] synthetase (radical SAM superfamily)
MKYVYGPIKSRRLGLSLGLSLSSDKTCDLDCVYCQWGSVGKTVFERKEYAPVQQVLAELENWLKNNPQSAKELKYVTLSGLGEPTLHTGFALLIEKARQLTGAKIAVITNSTFLGDAQVRAGLIKADLIVPSLDAVDAQIFRRIDRPHPQVNLEKIIQGLLDLRKEFAGIIWLEIMLVAGINDSPEHILQLKKVIDLVKPDKIQLNSPVRTTAERNIYPLGKARLLEIQQILGEKAEIV